MSANIAAKKIPDIIAKVVSTKAKNIRIGSNISLEFSGNKPANLRNKGRGAIVTQNNTVAIAAHFLPKRSDITGAMIKATNADANRGSWRYPNCSVLSSQKCRA